MSEIATLKTELKSLTKRINIARNKKVSTTDAGKRIQYESEIEELDEQIKAIRNRITEIQADPNYVPEEEEEVTEEKGGFMKKLKNLFS